MKKQIALQSIAVLGLLFAIGTGCGDDNKKTENELRAALAANQAALATKEADIKIAKLEQKQKDCQLATNPTQCLAAP